MEQTELTPLTKGAVTATDGSGTREKLDLPVGKIIEAHISHNASFGKFPKEVTDDKTGETKTIQQNKVIFTFVIDKGDLKGKTFSKTFALSTNERATYRKLSLAVLGKVTTDPADLLGMPLAIIAAAWEKFQDTDYQPLTYLPPQEGQEYVPAEELPSDDEVDAVGSDAVAVAAKVFGKGTEEVK